MADRRAVLMSLLGKPYVAGATGPDAYDCAGLAAAVWRDVFGRTLPSREDTAAVRRAWRQLDRPEDGAVTMMKADDTHIGIWLLPEGGCIHALDGRGVVFDTPHGLLLRGFANPRFYLPREDTMSATTKTHTLTKCDQCKTTIYDSNDPEKRGLAASQDIVRLDVDDRPAREFCSASCAQAWLASYRPPMKAPSGVAFA